VSVARGRGRLDVRRVVACAAASLLLSCAPASAQDASDTFRVGLEAGLSFTNLDGLGGSDRLNRVVFGVVGDWKYSEHVHFGAALLPLAGRGADGLAPVPTGDSTIDAQIPGSTMKRSLDYFEIPLLVRWAPERDLGFASVSGRRSASSRAPRIATRASRLRGTHYQIERSITNQLTGIDLGFSLEAEWRFPQAAIALRFTRGHTDVSQNGSPEESHSRALTATGQMYFGKTAGVTVSGSPR
jgi:hypothetical protein